MSLINQCTMDLPPTLIRGLGVVSVWGRMRFPIPAIGIINLILVVYLKYKNRRKGKDCVLI